jgi:hypothetical protein
VCVLNASQSDNNLSWFTLKDGVNNEEKLSNVAFSGLYTSIQTCGMVIRWLFCEVNVNVCLCVCVLCERVSVRFKGRGGKSI